MILTDLFKLSLSLKSLCIKNHSLPGSKIFVWCFTNFQLNLIFYQKKLKIINYFFNKMPFYLNESSNFSIDIFLLLNNNFESRS